MSRLMVKMEVGRQRVLPIAVLGGIAMTLGAFSLYHGEQTMTLTLQRTNAGCVNGDMQYSWLGLIPLDRQYAQQHLQNVADARVFKGKPTGRFGTIPYWLEVVLADGTAVRCRFGSDECLADRAAGQILAFVNDGRLRAQEVSLGRYSGIVYVLGLIVSLGLSAWGLLAVYYGLFVGLSPSSRCK